MLKCHPNSSRLPPDQIHIEEENIQFFWGLLAVVFIGLATYMLINAFMAGDWRLAGYTQLVSLILFAIGFYGIIRISSPLFQFVLTISGSNLIVEIWNEGDEPIDTRTIQLNDIKELRINPHRPRSTGEALFDFSTGYHLLYKPAKTDRFKRLIDLQGKSFTLKIEDIGRIMHFLTRNNPRITVPENDAIFVEMNRSSPRTIRG